ncbi:hypothetical protein [Silvibacterium dinghuense]|uniref:Uncharacterized protein n=1 Tax=Silvibacterium dinghuense TaxID=1560006 RepID=A0A4Q1S8J4_9BACT|nr:hypothetical protein [Silvibacterium dinghuense]RXS93314.1 hypothetical protein ESZ00_18340 [Silvibacterium dinghuense]
MATNDSADIACTVCGHQYKLYFERPSEKERAEAVRKVESALKEHHLSGKDNSVHPAKPFNIPAWRGPAMSSGAAMLGGAPLSLAS